MRLEMSCETGRFCECFGFVHYTLKTSFAPHGHPSMLMSGICPGLCCLVWFVNGDPRIQSLE